MIRFLSVSEVRAIHERVIRSSGGSRGLRDLAALESAVHQPLATYEGEDLYLSLSEKAAALAFSLVNNHAFVDGNKRIGHAALEVFLVLNGFEIESDVDEQERIFQGLAAGSVTRSDLIAWIDEHLVSRRA